MKHILPLLLALLCSAAASGATSYPTLPKGFYTTKSKFAEGNWVKISVSKTGVYEISYDALRAMGFADPEKVGVYGRGGKMLDINFMSYSEVPLVSDDIAPVAVYHLNDKLYFYGIGTDDIYFRINSSYHTSGYFYRRSRNIYSNYGYYFLSDKEAPKKMAEVKPTNVEALRRLDKGIAYYNHEEDLTQNNTYTGQLFLGERLSDMPHYWKASLPGAIPASGGALEFYFYCDRDIEGKLKYGVRGTDNIVEYDTRTFATTNFRPQEPYLIQTMVPSDKIEVEGSYTTSANPTISHVDYWTLTYQRSLPTLRDPDGLPLAQEYIALPGVFRGLSVALDFQEAPSMVVFDITDRTSPKHLIMAHNGLKSSVKVTNSGSMPEIVCFDPLRPQLQIHGFEDAYKNMDNQDLHGQIADGADLLIITVPELYDASQRLAEVHRSLEGLKVVVATTEQVYNEFSQGIPDAMAYRSFVKMAYETDHPVKNLLLVGPLCADFRGLRNPLNPLESIIAFQSDPMNQLRGAQNANDFYGMMDDILPKSAIEKNYRHVGVGILPCRFPAELDNVTEKVRKHISRTDHAYFLNRQISAGGVGDDHTHDKQAKNYTAHVNAHDFKADIMSTLIVDAYGYSEAHKRLRNLIESGVANFTYFGHGSPYLLNHKGDFLKINQVQDFCNSYTPFMSFAGCKISNCDRGIRGLGEAFVVSTPYGALGSFLATRQTWSGQNYELFRDIGTVTYLESTAYEAPRLESPITIGELIARAKSASTYNNNLAYQLICDPAVVIPTVMREIKCSAAELPGVVGEYNQVEGTVCRADGEIDATYCGEVVIRLMEPFKQLVSQDICSKEAGQEASELKVVYADTQVAMTTAEVVNGKFSARLFVPEEARQYADVLGRLHIAAYDPATRIGAGTMLPMRYIAESSTSSALQDVTPPVIERFEFNVADNSIVIAVSDNLALSFSETPMSENFLLRIDGKELTGASRHEAVVSDHGAAFSKVVPIHALPEGSHSAMLTVADAAGNTSSAEIVFSYSANSARYRLRMEEDAVAGNATFRVDGNSPAKADLVIIDNAGNIVFRAPIADGIYHWDSTGLDGAPVAPGLYKAYIIEQGDFADKSHSATIDVPVI